MAATQKMRCHYEVLEVERTATEDELRKSYRKLALKLHPDKNVGQEEEAHRRFQELQQAYAVLTDPQERAWYDSHRESILRGGDGTAGEDGVHHEGVNIWPYFSPSCYRGFADDPDDASSFWNVYGRLFATLEEEEETYGPTDAASKKAAGGKPRAPAFGNSKAEWAEVARFYAYWEGFCSHKTFAWCDRWNLTQADGRRMKRAMEKENKKERDKAKRAFNENVRHLVDFVKKRDKRVSEHMKEVVRRKQEEAEKAAERKKEQEREKQERMKRLQAQMEAQAAAEAEENGEDDELLQETLREFEEEEEDEEDHHIFCAYCNKNFKSDKAWQNHEKSKKHLQNVQAFAAELVEADLAVETENGEGDDAEVQGEEVEDGEEDDEAVEEDGEEAREEEAQEGEEEQVQAEEADEDEEEGGEPEVAASRFDVLGDEDAEEDEKEDTTPKGRRANNKKKNKKNRNKQAGGRAHGAKAVDDDEEETSTAKNATGEDEEEEDEEDLDSLSRGRKSRKERRQQREQIMTTSAAERKGKKGRRAKKNAGAPQAEAASAAAPAKKHHQRADEASDSEEEEAGRRGGRRGAKAKGAKGRAAGAKAADDDAGLRCGICGEEFDSRNKLFQHIKAKGHAQLK